MAALWAESSILVDYPNNISEQIYNGELCNRARLEIPPHRITPILQRVTYLLAYCYKQSPLASKKGVPRVIIAPSLYRYRFPIA
jgi:hypothetical protein